MKRLTTTLIGFLVTALAAAPAAAENNASGTHFDISQWRQYLAQQLDPGLASVDLSRHPAPQDSDWKQLARHKLLPDFARELFTDTGTSLASYTLTNTSTSIGLNVNPLFATPAHQLGGLQQNFIQPGLVARLSEDSLITVGAVLVSQRYGASLLDQTVRTAGSDNYYLSNLYGDAFGAYGSSSNNNSLSSPFLTNRFSSTQGAGVRLGYSYNVFPWLQLGTNYQSKIDTEALNELIGVYADPAELDIPARIGASIGLATSADSQLRFGVERVNYSDVNSFSSQLLPGRFLSLLGDSNSPAFNYTDLTVYTASWAWQPTSNWSLQVQFSTRTQPLPDSSLLADALRSELADSSYGLFVTRSLSLGELHFGASYAPADIAFGGNALGVISDELGQNFEASLSWRLAY